MKTAKKSLFHKLKGVVKLTRIDHGLMVAAGILVGGLSSAEQKLLGYNSFSELFTGCIVGILAEMGIFGFNDYFNVEEDRINAPDRPLVQGVLSMREALWISSIFLILGLAISFVFLSVKASIILLAIVILDMGYNIFLKKLGIVGNFAVAVSTAMPFIFGSVITVGLNNVPLFTWLFFLTALIATLAREIVKGIIDVPGDLRAGVRTMAIVAGEKLAARIAFYLIIAAILLSLVTCLVIPNKLLYLPPTILCDYMLFKSAQKLVKSPNARTAELGRKSMLRAMGIGMLGFFLGSYRNFF